MGEMSIPLKHTRDMISETQDINNSFLLKCKAGAHFEGGLGKILALGAEILPYIGLREK